MKAVIFAFCAVLTVSFVLLPDPVGAGICCSKPRRAPGGGNAPGGGAGHGAAGVHQLGHNNTESTLEYYSRVRSREVGGEYNTSANLDDLMKPVPELILLQDNVINGFRQYDTMAELEKIRFEQSLVPAKIIVRPDPAERAALIARHDDPNLATNDPETFRDYTRFLTDNIIVQRVANEGIRQRNGPNVYSSADLPIKADDPDFKTYVDAYGETSFGDAL